MCAKAREAVIVAYGRSPVAKAVKGSLKDMNPVDYAAQVLSGVLNRIPQLPAEQIDDVVVGTSYPERYLGNNVGRQIVLRAGLPFSVPGYTLNRFCSSGLQSIASAANAIAMGQGEVMVAGGVEVMDRQTTSPDPQYFNPWLEKTGSQINVSMGITAENVAAKYHITREDEDTFAAESHRRAALARAAGKFQGEIVPIQVPDGENSIRLFEQDECIREGTTVEKLLTLAPAFLENGVVTAGNSSQLGDGASFVVQMSLEKAQELALRPIARLVSFAVGGVDPALMGIGPIVSVPKVLKQSGLSTEDMDVIELNEAFASQSLAVIRTLGLDPEKVNPNGGAIAMGHPLGATGAILTCKLLAELSRRGGRYGMVTMCIGGGMGASAVFEML